MFRLTFLLLLSGIPLFGQSISKGPEKVFAFKVKEIDEFIERFNHDPGTLARQQYPDLSHAADLYSLFDQENKNWNPRLVEAFVTTILQLPEKQKLDFYDSGWYAELNCTFSYREEPRQFTLILQNQLAPNGGSKWVIVSVLQPMQEVFCEDIPAAKSTSHYLHPMSHVTNFMELERAFEDKDNLQNFFDPWNQGMDFLAFKNSIREGILKYRSHQHLTYHFLQLENWIFTVDYFPRQDQNSGWLISSLSKASEEVKKRYLAEKLKLL